LDIHKIKVAIFDLGNVLVFFNFSKMLTQLAECTGLTVRYIGECFIQKGLREQYEIGTLSSDDLIDQFRKESPKSFSDQEFLLAASDIFNPNESCYPLLQALKEKGIKLLALSNMNKAHFEFLKKTYSFLELFDGIILSYIVGISKPNPKIFLAALKEAGCSPQECFYVDDTIEHIDAAKTHGIDAELFTDVESLKSHLNHRQII
jgi:HAD superfamily hydrolase (TIGR01509 family)